jgi:hypothetical protein
MKSEETDPNLSFEGPFLIRRENGYCVASLPYYDVIIPTYVDRIDWAEFLSLARKGTRERGRIAMNEDQKSKRKGWYFKGHWHNPPLKDDPSDSAAENEAFLLKRAVDDPSPIVKRYAKMALENLEQKQD